MSTPAASQKMRSIQPFSLRHLFAVGCAALAASLWFRVNKHRRLRGGLPPNKSIQRIVSPSGFRPLISSVMRQFFPHDSAHIIFGQH
jgi:hypothetical protein